MGDKQEDQKLTNLERLERRLELHRMDKEVLISVYLMADCLGHEDWEMILDEMTRRDLLKDDIFKNTSG